jgi:pimeloyl-ACP methyl ester carboxylesterase
VIDQLAEIEVPALVIVGSEDEAFRRAAEVMAAKLPAAVHRVVEGAGHILNIERAAEFDSALLEFLASLEPLAER